jgi:CobQ-like glutamine amidotransferase family enzyme
MNIVDQILALQNNEKIIQQLDEQENFLAIKKQCHQLLGTTFVHKKGYNLAPLNVLGVSHPNQSTFKISI